MSKQYGLDVNPNAYIRDISVGMQQRVEILKTLYRGANVLIFDEPTAVLTPQEIDELMIILKELTDEGKSIILITHKLDEIKKVADRCTVIRRGQSIGTVNVKDVSSQQLADMMVGRSVSFKTEKKPAQPKETILSIKDLVVKESRGLDAVPEDRHKYGLVLEMTLAENIGLQTYYQKPYSSTGILNYRMINKHARELIEEYDVRTPNELVPARALSGGNQQKAIIAREVDRDPDLLIVSQPTRGLDVGAIEYIHRRLIEQRDKNKAVLLVSFELDEILNVSDRIAVIHAGEIVGIVDPKETTENELGLLMAGYSLEEARAELSKVEAGETVE